MTDKKGLRLLEHPKRRILFSVVLDEKRSDTTADNLSYRVRGKGVAKVRIRAEDDSSILTKVRSVVRA